MKLPVMFLGSLCAGALLAGTAPAAAQAMGQDDGPFVEKPAGEAEWIYCGCTDTPHKHFPYSVVVFKTDKGDVVARPERSEMAVTFTILAIRYGDRYCDVNLEHDCYGSFAHPCEFTDYKYGAYLEQFFPTCKHEDGVAPTAPERN